MCNTEDGLPKVLIIDDDSEVLQLLSHVLGSHFAVSVRSSANNLLEDLRSLRPNILITDIAMPGMNGLDVCNAVRAEDEYDLMPIVVLSAYSTQSDRFSAYDAGADDFLSKPFNISELKAKLSVWSRMATRSRQLMLSNLELTNLVRTDPLTGLISRRHVLDIIEQEFARFERYKTVFSVLLIDVDCFKHINDTWGHAAGDKALKATAEQILTNIRKTDYAARYGGDEFLVILPESDQSAAEAVCKKLVASPIVCTLRDCETTDLTFSIGGTCSTGKDKSTAVIDAADLAMLAIKGTSRMKWNFD